MSIMQKGSCGTVVVLNSSQRPEMRIVHLYACPVPAPAPGQRRRVGVTYVLVEGFSGSESDHQFALVFRCNRVLRCGRNICRSTGA
jgi:hypothetical protein